jgi:hypothetical protein
MNPPVGIRSLALSFPSIIRTNDYWIEKSPELTARNKPRRARISRSTELTNSNNGLDIWSQEVAPYLPDPFRGSIERRVLAPNESSLTLEYQAAKEALDAAQLAPEEVDLAIVASLFPNTSAPAVLLTLPVNSTCAVLHGISNRPVRVPSLRFRMPVRC